MNVRHALHVVSPIFFCSSLTNDSGEGSLRLCERGESGDGWGGGGGERRGRGEGGAREEVLGVGGSGLCW